MNIPEQLGCEDNVFLSPLVRAYETDGLEIGPETTLAIRGLRTVLTELKHSDDPYDQQRLAAIDTNFMDLDSVSYDQEFPSGSKSGRRLTSRLSRANRQQIVDFGIWYQGRVAVLGKQLAHDQPVLAADTLQKTSQLIDHGMFPASAQKVMERSVAWAGNFQPIGSVEQAANSHAGYCSDDGIGLANLYTLPEFPAGISLQMKQTSFHEYLHGVGHLGTNRRGLFFGLTHQLKSTYNRWLEEAFVSTVAHAATKLHANPRALATLPQTYPTEQKFLKLAMHVSPYPIDMYDLSAAHFSGRSPRTRVRQHVAEALRSGLNDLYPEFKGQAWHTINKGYANLGRRPDREEYLADLLLAASVRTSYQGFEERAA